MFVVNVVDSAAGFVLSLEGASSSGCVWWTNENGQKVIRSILILEIGLSDQMKCEVSEEDGFSWLKKEKCLFSWLKMTGINNILP